MVPVCLLWMWQSGAHSLYVPTPTVSYSYPSSTPVIPTAHYQTYRKYETPHANVRKYDTKENTAEAVIYPHVPLVPNYYPHYTAPHLYHKAARYEPTYHYSPPTYYAHSSYPAYSVHHAPVYTAPSYQHVPHYVDPHVKPAPYHVPATVPYSDATSVSHISFEGLGTSYSW